MQAFDRAGAVTWKETQGNVRAALVAAWSRDTVRDPEARRFVFAYRNRDVDRLNAELRAVRRERGQVEAEFETKHGRAAFTICDGCRSPRARSGRGSTMAQSAP